MTDTHDTINRKAALAKITEHSDVARKKMAVALDRNIQDNWSAIVGHLDIVSDAIAALPSAGVTVKPLEWRKNTMPSIAPQRYNATTHGGFGDYSVTGYHHKDEWQWFRNGYFVDGHQHHAAMAFEAAKAAAQADYEARIMAALDVHPTPAPSPDVALVRAAEQMLDAFCVHEDSHQIAAYEAMCSALAALARKGGA